MMHPAGELRREQTPAEAKLCAYLRAQRANGVHFRRLAANGCQWADLSLTGKEDTDTWPLANRMGAKGYKRYRFYEKEV
jgi:hypothetical protein